MGASFWSSKVGLCYLSGSYENFVKWAFLSFWVWVWIFFLFSFFFPRRKKRDKDRPIDRPTDGRTTTYKPNGWMNEWDGLID
jgi:hypothetical protein